MEFILKCNKYFTSDLHLDHESAIDFNDRPFKSVNEMQVYILDQIVELPKGSILYVLGDTLVRANKTAARELLGKLPKHVEYVFVMGNHDYNLRNLFTEFGRVEDLLQIRYGKRKIVLSHYPMHEWSSGHHGSVLLHGHTHGRMQFPGITLDVGWDVHKRPISADEVVELVKDRKIYQPVHDRNNGRLFSELD